MDSPFRTTESTELLIIGAGMCGLMLATALYQRNDARTVLLADKGRSVGGRLATRRLGNGRADHGAQFFTVRDRRFQTYVDTWRAAGIVYVWSTGWSDGSIAEASTSYQADGHPRYAVNGGMNALAKHLAGQLAASPGTTIRTGLRIESLTPTPTGWQAATAEGDCLTARTVVVTTPVPQALALFQRGETAIGDDDRAALEQVAYAPCVCGLYVIDGAVHLPDPGAIQQPNAPVTWIADNRRKGISPRHTVMTVHAGPDLSRRLYHVADAEVEWELRTALQPFLSLEAVVAAAQIKRWRYAMPISLYPERYLRAQGLPPLFFGGDAFGGPRVEGAALSGLALADHLANEV